jgi:hypothetical protein
VTVVEEAVVNPRESVQAVPTVIEPVRTPAVLRVAAVPLPETLPLLAVQLATDTEPPSGLMHLAAKLTAPPACRVLGRAEIDIVGGFLRGRGFTVKFAQQVASLFFFSLVSVTRALTV